MAETSLQAAGSARPASVLRDTLISLVTTLICIAVFCAAGEVYFRATRPFLATQWPLTFVDGVGFLITPGGTIRDTNNIDYWSQQTANAQGFLADLPQETPGACRVALIGDSFVQAVQIPIGEKIGARLIALGEKEKLPLAVGAYGYGGTGQLNQLPFYDRYARAFAPRVVVLVYVANDFANNSAVLESIRSGIDPDHPHRMFARRNAEGAIVPLPVDDKGWRDHMLKVPTREGRFIPRANMWLQTHSYFYAWAFTKLAMVSPGAAVFLAGSDRNAVLEDRAELIAARPAYRDVMEGWDPARTTGTNPTLQSMDVPFSWEKMPPVFREAMAFSGYALDQFKARAERDGAQLVILSTDNMRAFDPGQLRFRRLQALAAERQIPLVDMTAFMEKRGYPEGEATFAHDGHWTPKGHAWAAEALFDYFAAHPALCQPPAGQPASGAS
ncbi:hypothetical protein GCM10007301_26000 [Azorhizobium oxalatiphilum]|uniref:SGNH hydrolase-type esterase domain-containing protein n=1 Tax=Azorhizobium oxalatiphilum TaxID=980631 RepID=A0A917BZQ4_9HYPH|nr:hypothetical protein [Azorhizobium oxalatiphilum]GGF65001.1 hypothetical protein GCM10007301_26000 [Azorhizobium oxalatiphilum]